MFMKCLSSCLARMYLSFAHVNFDLAFVCTRFRACFNTVSACVHMAVCRASPGHVPTPGPPCQCGRRQRTCVPAASRTDTDIWEVVCSTDQAPESLNLCCHSLPSAGPDPPFPGRVPRALVSPICPVRSRSGRAGRAGMCAGFGSDGTVCAVCAHVYYVRTRSPWPAATGVA